MSSTSWSQHFVNEDRLGNHFLVTVRVYGDEDMTDVHDKNDGDGSDVDAW
jgi:hypothetical protein